MNVSLLRENIENRWNRVFGADKIDKGVIDLLITLSIDEMLNFPGVLRDDKIKELSTQIVCEYERAKSAFVITGLKEGRSDETCFEHVIRSFVEGRYVYPDAQNINHTKERCKSCKSYLTEREIESGKCWNCGTLICYHSHTHIENLTSGSICDDCGEEL